MEVSAISSRGSSEQGARQELAKYCRLLHRLGFTPGTAGNLSVRLDEERILSTPTGCSKMALRAADMVMIDPLGRRLCGSRNVTSEIGMHLAVYEMRSDVHAVVHAHPTVATAFASCGRALDEPLCEEIVLSVGSVPLAPYALTGTPALAQAIAPFIPDHHAILLSNHGAVTYGESLIEAFMRMETVEHFAQMMLAAEQLGSKKLLHPEQIADLVRAKQRYVRNSSRRQVEMPSEEVAVGARR